MRFFVKNHFLIFLHGKEIWPADSDPDYFNSWLVNENAPAGNFFLRNRRGRLIRQKLP
jgi:hypothetical protein